MVLAGWPSVLAGDELVGEARQDPGLVVEGADVEDLDGSTTSIKVQCHLVLPESEPE